MNVKELIATLQGLPPDLPVLMHSYDNEWGDHAGADIYVATQQEVKELIRHDPHPTQHNTVVAVTKQTPVVLLWSKQERESFLKYHDGYTVDYHPPL